jgi:hypothetical protein
VYEGENLRIVVDNLHDGIIIIFKLRAFAVQTTKLQMSDIEL